LSGDITLLEIPPYYRTCSALHENE